MSQAAQHAEQQQQLGFFGRVRHAAGTGNAATTVVVAREGSSGHRSSMRRVFSKEQSVPLCAGCREKEARYGFLRREDDPATERPRTLCFECFRGELVYRQDVTARLARGWNASQVPLPLEEKLNELTRRRRRAQIAARHALDVQG